MKDYPIHRTEACLKLGLSLVMIKRRLPLMHALQKTSSLISFDFKGVGKCIRQFRGFAYSAPFYSVYHTRIMVVS